MNTLDVSHPTDNSSRIIDVGTNIGRKDLMKQR
jgi:hypothetical protein